jgi:hypothetical protein
MNVRDVISIFYPDAKARLGELVVDAFILETHSFSSEITEHPIESGSSIVDHVHNKPVSLSIDGIISNTPMSLVGLTAFDSAARYFSGESNDFATMAFEKIEDIFAKRMPITIATSLKTYHKMVLETLSIERGVGAHESLHFTCTAKQIRFAHQEQIKVPEAKVQRAQPKQKKGLQETKPIAKEQVENLKQNNSLIFSLAKKVMDGS